MNIVCYITGKITLLEHDMSSNSALDNATDQAATLGSPRPVFVTSRKPFKQA